MTRILDRLHSSLVGDERSISTIDDLAEFFKFKGVTYPFTGTSGTSGTPEESLEHSFTGYVDAALKGNGIVFACVAARLMLFSEVGFQWRNRVDGNTFTDQALAPLQRPGAGRTTQEMLALCGFDASFAGNSYWVRDGAGLRRLRPDWVKIVTGSPKDGQQSTDLLGYIYTDGGPSSGSEPVPFMPEQVAHYSPIPDPTANYRGMSWITPIVQEILADSRFTKHRGSVARESGMHTFAVKYPEMTLDSFKTAVEAFRSKYEGPQNSGKSIHISGGADVTPLSMDLRAMDFKNVLASGETRIAAASRVPAVIAGISEGLAGSSLNQGNYGMARRQFGDLYARPAWRSLCGAFQTLLSVPAGEIELWYSERDISFLREDQKDAADVQQLEAVSIRTLIDGGFDAKSAVAAVKTGDWDALTHTGLVSVQMQPPGQKPDEAGATEPNTDASAAPQELTQ